MARYEAEVRGLVRHVPLPPSLAIRPVCEPEIQLETAWDDDVEAEDAPIIAARLGGVDRFD